eukprot:ANDGO_05749.mRNA.1 putative serine/threonine-protein kinase DDB_G0280111
MFPGNKISASSYVGKQMEVAGKRLRIEQLVAEGGFSFVFTARDLSVGRQYALKKVLCQNKETLDFALLECKRMEVLPKHPNLIEYFGNEITDAPPPSNAKEVWILMEYASGSHLVNYMNERRQRRFTEGEIFRIFYDVCLSVAMLHSCEPPIAHRDLKVENILLSHPASAAGEGDLLYKLCDFGSCTTKPYTLVTKEELQEAEADIGRNTTMAYRAPEQCDLYARMPVYEKVDVWALGCILYKLCYYKTPFEDNGALQIINVKYDFPPFPQYSQRVKDLISKIFIADPVERPDTFWVLEQVCQLRQVAYPLKVRPGKYKTQLQFYNLKTYNEIVEEERAAKKGAKGGKGGKGAKKPAAGSAATATATAAAAGGGGLFGMVDWYGTDGGVTKGTSSAPTIASAAPLEPVEFEANFDGMNLSNPSSPANAKNGFGNSGSFGGSSHNSGSDSSLDFFTSTAPAPTAGPDHQQTPGGWAQFDAFSSEGSSPFAAETVPDPLFEIASPKAPGPGASAFATPAKPPKAGQTPARATLPAPAMTVSTPAGGSASKTRSSAPAAAGSSALFSQLDWVAGDSAASDNSQTLAFGSSSHKAASSVDLFEIASSSSLSPPNPAFTGSSGNNSTSGRSSAAASHKRTQSASGAFSGSELRSPAPAPASAGFPAAASANTKPKRASESSFSILDIPVESPAAHGGTDMDSFFGVSPSGSHNEGLSLFGGSSNNSPSHSPYPATQSQGFFASKLLAAKSKLSYYMKDLPSYSISSKSKGWIIKATSRLPTAPKHKYVRRILVDIFESVRQRGDSSPIVSYAQAILLSRPVLKSAIVALKVLITLHHCILNGPVPEFRNGMRARAAEFGPPLAAIAARWKPTFRVLSGFPDAKKLFDSLPRNPLSTALAFKQIADQQRDQADEGELLVFVYAHFLMAKVWSPTFAFAGWEQSSTRDYTDEQDDAVMKYSNFLWRLCFDGYAQYGVIPLLVGEVYETLCRHPTNSAYRKQVLDFWKQVDDSSQYQSRVFLPSLDDTLTSIKSSSSSTSLSNTAGSPSYMAKDDDDDDNDDDDDDERTGTNMISSSSSSHRLEEEEDASFDTVEDVSVHRDEKSNMSLDDVLKVKGNEFCADCGARNPRWASINIGVFVCHACAGLHRNLGVHISKVRSVTLDFWAPETIAFMASHGNVRVNSRYEANLRDKRPSPQQDMAEMQRFVRDKYMNRKFYSETPKTPARPAVPAAGGTPASAAERSQHRRVPSANMGEDAALFSQQLEALRGSKS